MSKISITPNPSGTGVFTIASPATNTDRTLTLPDEAGTVLTSASSLASANLTGAVTVSGSNVGIGTTPTGYLTSGYNLRLNGGTQTYISLNNTLYSTQATGGLVIGIDNDAARITQRENAPIVFGTNNSDRMRIDSSGNVLVGSTDLNNNNSDGVRVIANGTIAMRSTQATANSGQSLLLDRRSTDGAFINFKTAPSTTVGTIGTVGSCIYIGSAESNLRFNFGAGQAVIPATSAGAVRDNIIDLGESSARFDDIYATNGTIQTSDRNEKQDIETLSEAEQRVAVACKGLLRKFRWIDAVAEKGDDARIHFGIIAQDLQDAFAAEGLDAGRYAMFISSTWWETDRVVPAVEAVEGAEATYDDEGNQLTEAVEAVVAVAEHTVTDTYDTLEKAPEGATERTRLGVRYSELLAFIIGAL